MQPASTLPAENESGVAEGSSGPSTAVPNPAVSVGHSSERVLPDPPEVRLCHLVRRPNFDGYGFTLHEDKEHKKETVLTVEPDSPAEAAGLRLNDIIIEVNGINVEGANHQDILDRIKSVPNETRLLVADDSTVAWYKEHGITLTGSVPSVTAASIATTADNITDASPSSTGTKTRAADLLEGRDDQQEPSKVNLLLGGSDTDESFLCLKQKSDSQAEATVRRRAPADKLGTSAEKPHSQAKTGPNTVSAPTAANKGELAAPCVHLSPLEALEWMLRAVIPMQLPLPMLFGLVTFLLLILYYFYSYVYREQQA